MINQRIAISTLGILSLSIFLSATEISAADKIWQEKEANAQPLVNLPNLRPVIDVLDVTIVNVAGTTDPQAEQKRQQKQRGPQNQQPMDPFMGPDEFFERFFGNPYRDQPQQPRRTLGSGFIISKDGYILTNNHVVEGADKIEITLLQPDNAKKRANKFQAKIVGRDPSTDVALLKISTGFDLPFAYLGDSTKMKKGDWVMAFGNPFGLDHSVSVGIISALGREISPGDNRRFDDFMQTDAAINFGNSGGPLVNLKGEVVGINTAITAQGSGIGFAVPINIAKEIVPQLKDNGQVARGYLGVMIQDVTEEIREAMGLKEARGVLVNDVVPGGPAAKSALQRGDVILKVGDLEVNDTRALQKSVANVKPGVSVSLDIIRDKKPMKLSLKLGTLGQDKEGKEKKDESGSKADKLGIIVGMTQDGSAVQIQDMDEDSAAASAGIAPGDIIRRINGNPIKNIDQYKKATNGIKSGQTILFDLERKNVKLFIAYRLP
jgi:serine protease Do